jgi:hypothetical protein
MQWLSTSAIRGPDGAPRKDVRPTPRPRRSLHPPFVVAGPATPPDKCRSIFENIVKHQPFGCRSLSPLIFSLSLSFSLSVSLSISMSLSLCLSSLFSCPSHFISPFFEQEGQSRTRNPGNVEHKSRWRQGQTNAHSHKGTRKDTNIL